MPFPLFHLSGKHEQGALAPWRWRFDEALLRGGSVLLFLRASWAGSAGQRSEARQRFYVL